MSLKKWFNDKDVKELLAPENDTNSSNSTENSGKTSISKTIEHEDEQEELDKADPQLPFGNGDDKIFGFENFGYTCYCNSIIQCLYYTKDFRLEITRYPERVQVDRVQRERKLQSPGLKEHPAIAFAQSQQLPESPEESDPAKGKVTLARRTSNFFGLGRRATNEEDNDNEDKNDNNGNNTTVVTIPNIHDSNSKVIIGDSSDPSIDARKKAAMRKGPILNVDHSLNDYDVKESLFTSLKDLFESMIENESKLGIVSPSYLIETLKRENELFRSTMHQDAHEFLNFLINDVIDTINNHSGITKNGIHDLFEGVLTNQTKCLTCENITNRNETFLDLSIDLTNNESLENCLKQFSAKEMLNGNNKFYCDSCHSLQEAEKRMGLNKLPKILALHLKRFKYSEEQQRNVKLFQNIKYPNAFHLKGDIPNESGDYDSKNYELYGVVVHIGGGPHHGHYVALVKTPLQGWLLFDDETVEKIEENFVLKFIGDDKNLATAYVLFYRESEESVDDGGASLGKYSLDKVSRKIDATEADPLDKAQSVDTIYSPIHTNDKSIERPKLITDNLSNPALTRLRTKSSSGIPWLKRQPSNPSSPSDYNQQEPSPTATGSTNFWKLREKKEDPNKEKENEKKKNRMSMSFAFNKK